MVLLLLFAALARLLSVHSVAINPAPACFGGSTHGGRDHVATYGHHAGADGCRTLRPTSTLPQRSGSPAGQLLLHTRGVNGTAGSQKWKGSETAMVIIDMWSYHPCKTVTNRAGALVPRLNAVAAAVRAAGGLVLFAPTDAAEVVSKNNEVFKTRNCVSKTRNCVSKPRKFAFKNDEFCSTLVGRSASASTRPLTRRQFFVRTLQSMSQWDFHGVVPERDCTIVENISVPDLPNDVRIIHKCERLIE